jgi:hypothetical protein
MDPNDLLSAEAARTWQLRYLFISYRWESDQHIAWVRRFAEGLRSRGYPVALDQLLMESPNSPTTRIEQLLNVFGHLSRATHYLPILTDSYRRRLLEGNAADSTGDERFQDGWVYDEWTIAVNKSIAGELTFTGIWRSGDKLPKPFTVDNVCDFRGDDLDAALDQWFPPFHVWVTGLREDGTPARVVGPIPYNQWPEVATRLQQEEGFRDFGIVKDP